MEKTIQNLGRSIIIGAIIIFIGLYIQGLITKNTDHYELHMKSTDVFRINNRTGDVEIFLIDRKQNWRGWTKLTNGPIDFDKWYKKIKEEQVIIPDDPDDPNSPGLTLEDLEKKYGLTPEE